MIRSRLEPESPSHETGGILSQCQRTICRPRILYASVFLWISIVGGRFMAPFLEHEANLTSTQIGSIIAVQKVVYVLVSPFAGAWADQMELRFPRRGRTAVMAIGIFVGGISFLLHGASRVFSPQDDYTPDKENTFFQSVLWHGALRIVYGVSNALVFPVMDGVCLDFLKKDPGSTAQDYGKERLYGAVSWALSNILISICLDSYGFGVVYVLGMAGSIAVLAALQYFSTYQYRNSQNLKKRSSALSETDEASDWDDSNEDVVTLSSFKLLRLLLASCFGVAFVIMQVAQSSGQAIVDNLVFLFFEDLGSSYTTMGFSVLLTVAFEIPIFQIAPYLLRTLGAARLIQIAAFSYIVRVLGYSIVPEGEMIYVLCLEPLHGVTFACGATAGVEVLSSIVPRGSEASGQSLLQVFVGIGSILGLSFGGYLEDTMGPRLMYRVSALVVFVGCGIFTLALRFSSLTSPRHEQIAQEDEEAEDTLELSTLPERGEGDDILTG